MEQQIIAENKRQIKIQQQKDLNKKRMLQMLAQGNNKYAKK